MFEDTKRKQTSRNHTLLLYTPVVKLLIVSAIICIAETFDCFNRGCDMLLTLVLLELFATTQCNNSTLRKQATQCNNTPNKVVLSTTQHYTTTTTQTQSFLTNNNNNNKTPHIEESHNTIEHTVATNNTNLITTPHYHHNPIYLTLSNYI